MTLISTVNVTGSSASTISLTSIPQIYTDLLLKASIRTGQSAIYQFTFGTFNGSSSTFSSRRLEGSGTQVGSATGSNHNFVFTNANTSTSNTFGSLEMYIPNYAGSTNKSFSMEQITENNSSEAWMNILAGLWATTSAITSITFDSGGSNYLVGSSVSLYGITKGSGGATVS